MKDKSLLRRVLALVLTAAMLAGFAVPAGATGTNNVSGLAFEKVADGRVNAKLPLSAVEEPEEEPSYSDDEVVRVSIVLEKESTIAAGYSTEGIASNAAAMTYRENLKAEQAAVTAAIERKALDDEKLDVVWNLTLAANIISANVAYGDIEAIADVEGVKDVVVETRYEPMVVNTSEAADPNMGTSSKQIGSTAAWAAGYTGAGSIVAVIDTGIDYEHQSFDAGAFEYSLAQLDGEYNLLTAEKVAAVAGQLNAKIDAGKTYLNSKIPYAYNYVDKNYTVDHMHDSQGEHGSHVEGIAAANKYIPDGKGGYVEALNSVMVQGVAPDAQIMTMKVFGAGGGAYDSDYMVAIEDAIVLGAASVNLSLGSGNPGFSRVSSTYADIMASLAESDTVVCMSAGNSYAWATNSSNGLGYLYGDEVGFQTSGSPGSFTNSLSTASVNNDGATGKGVTVAGMTVIYNETSYSNAPMTSIAGEHEYVLLDGVGTDEEWAALSSVVAGKIALCYRGSTSFYQKGEAAVNAGAIATIIINNQAGVINMDLSTYTKTAPCVSILQADGAMIKANSNGPETLNGINYYTGTMTVETGLVSGQYNSDYYTMSDFSSWGVPGSLELKPEITAPGGSIYSVWGANISSDGAQSGHDQYENMSGTSMASPQTAGMAGVVMQYIRENDLTTKTGLTARQLAQSLLMSTAEPIIEGDSGNWYSILKQGAGLANVGNAVSAESYVLVNENLSGTAADGKVKVELGDDPDKEGVYSFGFTINNMTDKAVDYILSGEFFTQDIFAYEGDEYLDTWTTPIAANVTFTVDGTVLDANALVTADVDKDGDTDTMDAQCVLNYVAGTVDGSAYDLAAADVNGNGKVDTNDAYLILKGIDNASATLDANGTMNVEVTVELTVEQKAYLNEVYPNGAYVEGYVFAKPVATAEGVEGVTHSIPVLGFYGNWSQPTMYDQVSYTAALYAQMNGTSIRTPHTGVVQTNNLLIRYPGDSANYWQIGNPYMVENEFPADRLALSSDTTLYQYRYSTVRNAAALVMYVADEDGNIIDMSSVNEQQACAYYYVNGQQWRNTTYNITWNQKVSKFGVTEGDKIEVGLVAIPEYYETDGAITEEQLSELIASGVLGDGAFQRNTYTVDDTPPELLSVEKDLVTGNLTVIAKDNQYISSIQVLKGTSSKILAGGLPYQTQPGETCGIIAELDDSAGEYVTILVTDYADNQTVYKVFYGGTPEDYSNRMFGFTPNTSYNAWIEVTPEEVNYNSSDGYAGWETVSVGPSPDVYAAEYVDGYVFFTTPEAMFVAEQGDWDNYQKVANLNTTIIDMAYNYQDNTLYAIDNTNTLYSVDTVYGTLTEVADITITNPRSTSASYKALACLAIDDDGNFYSVNIGGSSYSYLYSWTLDDIVDGEIADLAPVNNASDGNMASLWLSKGATMAWDHNNDQLYLAVSYSARTSTDMDNELWIVDTTTGKQHHVGDANGQFRVSVVGLYVVPGKSQSVPGDSKVDRVEISETSLNVMVGVTLTLTADVYPWTVKDKSVTWTSSNENVVTVENGTITAVGVGTATITVASVADPTKTATCEVTVTPAPSIALSALVYGSDNEAKWSEFTTDNVANYTAVGDSTYYNAGTLVGDTLYTIDDSNMWAVDADTFAATSLSGIAGDWMFSDAAPMAPELAADFGGTVVAPCWEGKNLMILTPEAGSLSHWNGLSGRHDEDPLATIAYAGLTEYKGYLAAVYFLMTDSGELWQYLLYNEGYSAAADLGPTGLDLGSVSVRGDDKASMIYDAETGYLVISSYKSGDLAASIYLVDPDEMIPAKVATFSENVWPVVSLYQYERVTELTLQVKPQTASVYVGGTVTLETKVKPASYNGGVTFASSDEAIATVDENGVVTGVAPGEVTITVATVDTNEAGEHKIVTVPVTVKESISVNAEICAQVGTDYYTISLQDLSMTETGVSCEEQFEAGGMVGGELYGEIQGWITDTSLSGYNLTSYGDLYYAVDMANFPGFESETSTFTNSILFPSKANYLNKLDFATGKIARWNLASAGMNLCAITYVGFADDEEHGVTNYYYALGMDGMLYLVAIYEGDTADSLQLSRMSLGNTGLTFSDQMAVSMSYVWDGTAEGLEGLVIADASDMTLYWIANPSTAEDITAVAVGAVEGDYICSLYNPDWDGVASLTEANPALIEKIAVKGRVESVEMAETVNLADESEVMGAAVEEDFASAKANMSKDVAMGNRPTGSLNAVSAGKTDPVTNEVKVVITADADMNNGKYTVTYDAAKLTLKGCAVNAGCNAVNTTTPGTVVIALADTTAITEGNVVATLTFLASSAKVETVVEVVADEVGTTEPGTSEEVVIGHEHKLILVGARPATKTHYGYTGDIVCAECGVVLEEGEIIPATGEAGKPTDGKFDKDDEPVVTTPKLPFTDVKKSDEFYDSILYVCEKSLMNGTGATTFSPDKTLNRATVAMTLYRLAGEPAVTFSNLFTDVAAGDWYDVAVEWAANAGIVNGYGNGKFGPTDPVTREQLAAMLYRYAQYKGMDAVTTAEYVSGYSDGASVSTYAVSAMNWALSQDLIPELASGKLAPAQYATRAEVAYTLHHFTVNVLNK